MNKVEWEIIQEKGEGETGIYLCTRRLEVPGGWLVERQRGIDIQYHYFLEDPDHLWLAPREEIQVKSENAKQCPNPECEQWAYIPTGEKGGRCLACKIRHCNDCGLELTSEDLIEKCLNCGCVNTLEQ